MDLHERELEWVRQLQRALRSPWMDHFFVGWNYVDMVAFVLILISIVWYLLDRRVGIRLVYIFLLSGVVNKALKGYFALPRPCQIDPSVAILCSSSPGFPSGAAQTATLLAGIIFIECRKQIYRYLGMVFALFLCFSRIYLGLHYFTDILGGVVVGGILLLIYWKFFPLMEKKWRLSICLFPLLLLLIGQLSTLYFFMASIGIGGGLLISGGSEKYGKKEWLLRCLRLMSVVIGLFLFSKGVALYPKLTLLFGLGAGFWLSYLGAWAVQKIL